ncbi:rhomboid family intramembrane serine protease [Haloarchaeobius amylolyticus]|uniref:rhomboid family intramembrane serine protease n=1 Tax=Haloarchaeobius amylolyticus TaxID=1198296 RepID=UPI00226F3716|nr:rhomboid family intramembrane serine protease [Haloarchaeobius amylolyticus]
MDLLSLGIAVFVVVTLSVSLAVVALLDRPGGTWGQHLRGRLVMGVPWGTLVSVVFVVAVYLFVQDGWNHWYDPVTLPFRAWSYLYPTGMVLAPFSHADAGHLTGNMIGTLVLAPIAEYAYGHFPEERGSHSFADWTANPWVRALVVFPGVVLLVGLGTSLFALGPVIGFSGVVFAFAGFALVRYPMTTVVAVLGGQRVLSLLYSSLQNPIITTTAQPSPPSPPWWAGIAIQGHALGLFLGIMLGVFVFYRRDTRPSALRIWLAVLFFAVAKNLWAIYWFLGNETYRLFRGPGLAMVVALAIVVATALHLRERDLESFGPRTAALVVLVIVTAGLVGSGVPVNLMTVDDTAAPGDPIEVRGYEVVYAEDVQNQMVSVVDVEAFGQSTNITSSGVIVVNEERNIWYQAVSKGQLAFSGQRQVKVGGLGWRETVTASRDGWNAVGGGTAYRVFMKPPEGDWRVAFTSGNATAEPRLAGKNVSIAATEDGYELFVWENDTELGRAAIPITNESVQNASVTVSGIEFVREEQQNGPDRIYAVVGETKVRVFVKETYR